MTLNKYRQKRNFHLTSEPADTTKKKSSHHTLHFVVQKHAASHLHYDFRLEMNGVLKSWAVPKGPSLDPTIKRLAVQVEDHPLEYGEFEGIIPPGQYGQGTVMLWDEGNWIAEKTSHSTKGALTFTLKGKKLKGLWKLIQMKSNPKNWLLIKIHDQYARSANEYEITQELTSVKSGQTLEEITIFHQQQNK